MSSFLGWFGDGGALSCCGDWAKNICGAGDWLSFVSRVSCFVFRETVERLSRIGVGRAGWVCSVFLVSWRGPGRGGSRIRDRASLGMMGPFGNFVVSREGTARLGWRGGFVSWRLGDGAP